MKRFFVLACLLLIILGVSHLQATTYVWFWVNGDTSHVLTQGDIYAWEFDVATSGNTAQVDFYLDLDASKTITAADLLLEHFAMTDGETGDDGPTDSSSTPDGILFIQFGPFGFAPQNYLLRVTDADQSSVTNWFTINEMSSPAAQIHGNIFIEGVSAPDAHFENTMIAAMGENGMFSGLTDDQGNYTINLAVADANWKVEVLFTPNLSGYINSSSSYEIQVPAGGINDIDFYFAAPSAWLYGDLRDQDGNQVMVNGWIGIRNITLDQESNGQVLNGHFNLPLQIVPQDDNMTNYFRLNFDDQMFLPNYLTPNTYNDEFPVTIDDSLQKNITIYAANSKIYGYIYEQGSLPSQSYQFQANSEMVGSSRTNSDAQTGYFELPVRSGYTYYVGINDDPDWGTPLPSGYVLSGGNWKQASPGDTVRFYLIAAQAFLQGSISFEPGDPVNLNYDQNNINAWEINSSANYGTRVSQDNTYTLSVLNGNYNIQFNSGDQNYLSMPAGYENIVVNNNTVDTLDFMLNYGHAQLTIKLVNAPSPLGWEQLGIQTQGMYPNVYMTWANRQPGDIFNFKICEGEWHLRIPYFDPNYNIFPSDTILHVTEQDNSFYVEFGYQQSTGITTQEILPRQLYLKQNYPNPFNPSTQIEYGLPATSQVNLTVYNLAGQKIAVLVDSRQEAGRHVITWEPSQLASGIYLYRLETETGRFTKKLVLMQ